MLNCDKFFIAELQNAGYDIDYNRLTEIYKKSRQNPGFISRRNRQLQEAIMIADMEDRLNQLKK
jgi:hypothetical protein